MNLQILDEGKIMLLRFCLWAILGAFAFGKDIVGYYQLEKDKQGRQAIVEIFEYEDRYYGYGLGYAQDKGEQEDSHHLNSFLFLWGLAKSKKDLYEGGKLYNIEEGKTYDIVIKDKEQYLMVQIKAFFAPTLKWKRLSKEQMSAYHFNTIPKEEMIKTIPFFQK